MRLSAIYGHKFTSLFPTNDALAVAKSEWSDALAGLSNFQLSQGLDRCRKLSDWNPNIPEFIRLATNLPKQGLAVERALKREIVDPVTREMCARIGNYALNNSTTDELIKRLNRIYSDAYEAVLPEVWGADRNWMPPVKITNEPKRHPAVDREAAHSEIQKMKSMVGEPAKPLHYDEQEILAQLEKEEAPVPEAANG